MFRTPRKTLTNKADIEQWLIDKGMEKTQITIHDDLTVDINGHVGFKAGSVIHFFPFQFGVVSGNFYADEVFLQTLEGAPYEVGGNFTCICNSLKSLIFCPQKVGGTLSFSGNRITSLKGCPERLDGSFEISCNRLKTLRFAPVEIGGDFDCEMNRLQSLRYGPQKVGGSYGFPGNKIKTFKYLPPKINDSIDCSNTAIESLRTLKVDLSMAFELLCSETSIKEIPIDYRGIDYCPVPFELVKNICLSYQEKKELNQQLETVKNKVLPDIRQHFKI